MVKLVEKGTEVMVMNKMLVVLIAVGLFCLPALGQQVTLRITLHPIQTISITPNQTQPRVELNPQISQIKVIDYDFQTLMLKQIDKSRQEAPAYREPYLDRLRSYMQKEMKERPYNPREIAKLVVYHAETR